MDPAALEALRAHVLTQAVDPAALWLAEHATPLSGASGPPALARMLFDLSVDARGAERFELAEELLRHGLRIADACGEHEIAAAATNHLAILAEACGRLDRMNDWIGEAIRRRTSPPLANSGPTNHIHLAGVDCNYGNLMRQLGRTDAARAWYQQCIAALQPGWTPLAMQFLRNASESLAGLDEIPPPPFPPFRTDPIDTPSGAVDPDALRTQIDALGDALLADPEAHDQRLAKASALLDLGAALDTLIAERSAGAEEDRGVRFYLAPTQREARACASRARECWERLRLCAPPLAGLDALGARLPRG